MILLPFYVDDIIKTALTEDINYIDSTADLLIPEDSISSAYFMSKAEGEVRRYYRRVFGTYPPYAES